MEFKGTGGEWYFIETYSQMGSDDTTIASLKNNYVFTTAEKHGDSKYDALLISKAPELLDFIRRISGEMLRNDFVLCEKWSDQAEKLIKSAT